MSYNKNSRAYGLHQGAAINSNNQDAELQVHNKHVGKLENWKWFLDSTVRYIFLISVTEI
jgi:hypothetical protein